MTPGWGFADWWRGEGWCESWGGGAPGGDGNSSFESGESASVPLVRGRDLAEGQRGQRPPGRYCVRGKLSH